MTNDKLHTISMQDLDNISGGAHRAAFSRSGLYGFGGMGGSSWQMWQTMQAQLQAFRAFTISNEFQTQFGYPALTDAVKAQVLGLNAAKLFHLDAHA